MTASARFLIIDAEALRRELKAIGWDIMDCEPMKALERINVLLAWAGENEGALPNGWRVVHPCE